MKLYLVHSKTKRKFEILSHDKDTGMLTLLGDSATFQQKFDKELFKKLGYQLLKEHSNAVQ